MKKISVYDPPLCCSTGVCGPSVDPALTRFAGFLAKLKESGVEVERYNLAQQPMAFAQNAEVRSLMEKEGVEALPLVFIDDDLVCKGDYPEPEAQKSLILQISAQKN